MTLPFNGVSMKGWTAVPRKGSVGELGGEIGPAAEGAGPDRGPVPQVILAAVGDLHCGRNSAAALHSLFARLDPRADALLLCGDLTDYGHPDEARVLVKELATLKLPIVATLGNHDFESGRQAEVKQVLEEAGVHVLDGDACEIAGVGFAGVKGFIGGFGRYTLEPWGEEAIKGCVQEATNEALKLGAALAKLRTRRRVALLHYAPIEATVVGEPPALHPFLGSSRLEEPLERYPVDFVLHGHAHRGAPESTTEGGTPVYNVSQAVLRAAAPDQPPLRFFDIG
jgi:Icc-related predicted phosphoesterase